MCELMNSKIRIHTYLHCPASLKRSSKDSIHFGSLLRAARKEESRPSMSQKREKGGLASKRGQKALDRRVELTEINHQASYPWSDGELTVIKPYRC